MRSTRLQRVALFVILVSIVVPACTSAGTRSETARTSRSDFSFETRRDVDELEVKPDMRSNILRIKKMSLEAGQLVFRLSSPDGQVQWEKAFTAPASYQGAFELEVTPGLWKLEIELEDATGSYDIRWEASD